MVEREHRTTATGAHRQQSSNTFLLDGCGRRSIDRVCNSRHRQPSARLIRSSRQGRIDRVVPIRPSTMDGSDKYRPRGRLTRWPYGSPIPLRRLVPNIHKGNSFHPWITLDHLNPGRAYCTACGSPDARVPLLRSHDGDFPCSRADPGADLRSLQTLLGHTSSTRPQI